MGNFWEIWKNILSKVDRVPLLEIRGIKKLECFSEKRFSRLKEIYKEIKGVLKSDTKSLHKRFKSKEVDENLGLEPIEKRDINFSIDIFQDLGFERERWDLVIDMENYFGDLSREEEIKLNPTSPPEAIKFPIN